MRAFWRGDKPLRSHAEWRGKLGKNSKQGTSAPTLAAVWGGPVELMGALRHQPELEGLRLTQLVVEAQSCVDEFSGPRNHDLVAWGELPSGECVVICVEAKAGENFGATVKRQTSAAARAKSVAEKDGKTSSAPERLKGLLERFVNYPTSEPKVQNLRYQLLTALAGTVSEAEERGAQHAVLMVHEFLTDERPNAPGPGSEQRVQWEWRSWDDRTGAPSTPPRAAGGTYSPRTDEMPARTHPLG